MNRKSLLIPGPWTLLFIISGSFFWLAVEGLLTLLF